MYLTDVVGATMICLENDIVTEIVYHGQTYTKNDIKALRFKLVQELWTLLQGHAQV